MAKRQSTQDRFWSYVRKTDSCWLWTSGTRGGGYGRFWDGTGYTQAHRYAYVTTKGPIAPGLFVMHACDVRGCVNPEHLSLGTLAENNLDMTRKGRRAVGERSCHKLTATQVREIRASKDTATAFARRFGVTIAAVCYVRQGKTWRHL